MSSSYAARRRRRLPRILAALAAPLWVLGVGVGAASSPPAPPSPPPTSPGQRRPLPPPASSSGGAVPVPLSSASPPPTPPSESSGETTAEGAFEKKEEEHHSLVVPPPPPLLRDFLSDLSRIQDLPPIPLTTPCHLVMRDSSFTRCWKHDDWTYHCAPPLIRYARHLLSWPTSTTAERVLPAASFFVLWSASVAAACALEPALASALRRASFSSSVLVSTFLSPIALLLTLRTNRALDRLLDARKAWGLMSNACRSATGVLCSYAVSSSVGGGGAEAEAAAYLAARYLAVFGWALKARLRGEDDSAAITCALPPAEAEWLMSSSSSSVAASNRPAAMVARVRALVAGMTLSSSGDDDDDASRPLLPAAAHRALEERLQDLESVLGVCQRILTSPIPPTYTRHTSRVLCLYLGLLPLALTGLGVHPLATVVLAALTSYVLVGIDEIGVEIEYPFPLLPMHALATAVQRGVMDQVALAGDGTMPPSPS